MTDTTGFTRQRVYRVKFYVNFHDQGEKPDYVTDEEFEEIDLTSETIERDVIATSFEQALERAKHTMNEGRMGKGIDWEITYCKEISRPENAEYERPPQTSTLTEHN